MFGLTTLGAVHTLISLVALASGLWLLARDGQIASRNSLGRVYLAATALTALTALGIFRHGHAGAPHALAVMTLLAVAVGLGAERLGWFGRWSRHAQVVCYTT